MTVTRASLFGFRLAAAASATAPAAASALSAKVGIPMSMPKMAAPAEVRTAAPAEVRNDLRIKAPAPGVRPTSPELVQPNLVPDLAPAPAQVLPK